MWPFIARKSYAFMGGYFSKADAEPPAVVLVPPLIDSRERGRSKFAKSPYDLLFAKPQLRLLLEEHLRPNILGAVRFTPPEDPRLSVSAKLNAPAGGNTADRRYAAPAEAPLSTSSITLRFQPSPGVPHTFFDIKARTAAPTGGTAGGKTSGAIRGCFFHPKSRLALFGELPLVAGTAGPRESKLLEREPHLGARFTSRSLSVGAMVGASGMVRSAWAVGRAGPFTWGVQTDPAGLDLGTLLSSGLARPVGVGGHLETLSAAAARCRQGASWALALHPQGQSAYGRGVFTAAVELRRQRELRVCFLHHLAVQRNVRNPFESKGGYARIFIFLKPLHNLSYFS
jgi:hypothetical protein